MRQPTFFFLIFFFFFWGCDEEKKTSNTTILLPPSPKLTPKEENKKMLPRWVKGLQNRDPKIRQDMIRRIWDADGWNEDSAKQALLLHLRLEEESQAWSLLRDKILEVAPEQVLEVFLERLRDPRVLFRQSSFQLLSSWKEPFWIQRLKKIAQDPQDLASPYAILLLGALPEHPEYLETIKSIALRDNYIEPPLAIDLLVPLVQSDSSVHTFLKQLLREHISAPVRLYCLRKLAALLPLEDLLFTLQDPEGNVRREMIQQMIARPSEKTGEWLFTASQNIENRPDIRQRALEGLFQVQSEQALEACQLLLIQRNAELREAALKLLIENYCEEICWLGEALLSASSGEVLLALESPKLFQFPQLRIFVEPFLLAEDYELRSKSKEMVNLWSNDPSNPSLWDTPKNTFDLFQRSMSRFCLALSFSCFSAEYQRQNPSIEQTLNTLQNPVFRMQHKNLIQQLQLLEITMASETAIGTLNRGEVQFIREKGQWKINRIQLR